MEVSSRRIVQKHLEPARPLRRSSNGIPELGPMGDADSFKQAFVEVNRQGGVTVEQFCRILQLDKQSQGEICLHVPVPGTNGRSAQRISYTRDVLIELANCPEANKKPEFLPKHPVVLEKARAWAPPAEENQ